MKLSFGMLVKTPDSQEKSLGRYVTEQAVIGCVIARIIYCLCPLSGALLGAATAGSHVIRDNEILEKIPDPFKHHLLKINNTINKTVVLATAFFISILCVNLLTAPPLSYCKALIVMGYVHNMGEETTNKMCELKDKFIEKIKECLLKRPI